MSTTEVGAYWLLICACWIEEDLPNDIEELAATCRMPLDIFQGSWEKRLRRCFELDEKKDVFFHPRLRKEIKKQKEFRRKKSDAGKISGRKRREQKEITPEQALNSVQTKDEQSPTFLIPNSGLLESSYEDSKPPYPQGGRARSSPLLPIETNDWLDALAPIIGARDGKSLPNQRKWADVCAKAIRENRTVLSLIDAAQAERVRVGTEVQFFTPEGVLKRLQMNPPSVNGSAKTTPAWKKAIDNCRLCDEHGNALDESRSVCRHVEKIAA